MRPWIVILSLTLEKSGDWAQERISGETLRIQRNIQESTMQVRLVKPRPTYFEPKYTVYPILKNSGVLWIDSAGYPLADSPTSDEELLNIEKNEYILDINSERVHVGPYLKNS